MSGAAFELASIAMLECPICGVAWYIPTHHENWANKLRVMATEHTKLTEHATHGQTMEVHEGYYPVAKGGHEVASHAD